MGIIRYVFWDSDNTLVDTRAHHWNKHFETLKSLGIPLRKEWRQRIYQNNGTQNWEWLRSELGLSVDRDKYLDLIDRWYFDHIDEINIRPGVAEALDLLDGKRISMGVVSNGRRRSVMAALEARGIVPRFKFILCKEDYAGRKPGPEPYLAAKTKMQQMTGRTIDAKECLVIEDDQLGVESGKAAGMQVLHRPPEDDDPADFLRSLGKLLT